jgi:hypothetical protein
MNDRRARFISGCFTFRLHRRLDLGMLHTKSSPERGRRELGLPNLMHGRGLREHDEKEVTPTFREKERRHTEPG